MLGISFVHFVSNSITRILGFYECIFTTLYFSIRKMNDVTNSTSESAHKKDHIHYHLRELGTCEMEHIFHKRFFLGVGQYKVL